MKDEKIIKNSSFSIDRKVWEVQYRVSIIHHVLITKLIVSSSGAEKIYAINVVMAIRSDFVIFQLPSRLIIDFIQQRSQSIDWKYPIKIVSFLSMSFSAGR